MQSAIRVAIPFTLTTIPESVILAATVPFTLTTIEWTPSIKVTLGTGKSELNSEVTALTGLISYSLLLEK